MQHNFHNLIKGTRELGAKSARENDGLRRTLGEHSRMQTRKHCRMGASAVGKQGAEALWVGGFVGFSDFFEQGDRFYELFGKKHAYTALFVIFFAERAVCGVAKKLRCLIDDARKAVRTACDSFALEGRKKVRKRKQ